MYGGTDEQPTCRATPFARPTRRDYVFANSRAADAIAKFEVVDDPNIPVHSILRVTFKDNIKNTKYNAVVMPTPLNDIFINKCIKEYGEANIERENLKRERVNNKHNKISIEVDVPDDTIAPTFPSKRKEDEAVFEEAVLEEQRQDEDRTKKDDGAKLTPKQKEQQLAKLHSLIDKKLDLRRREWGRLLHAGDTDEYMELFAQCIEDATAIFGDLDAKQGRDIVGRSIVNIREKSDNKSSIYNPTLQEMQSPLRCNSHCESDRAWLR